MKHYIIFVFIVEIFYQSGSKGRLRFFLQDLHDFLFCFVFVYWTEPPVYCYTELLIFQFVFYCRHHMLSTSSSGTSDLGGSHLHCTSARKDKIKLICKRFVYEYIALGCSPIAN